MRVLIYKTHPKFEIWIVAIFIIASQLPILGEDASERKFSSEQYEMLERCSENEDVNEWNEWRIRHPNVDILLEDVLLERAHLAGVYLKSGEFTDKTGTKHEFTGQVFLRKTRLNNAYLREANFEGADLEEIQLTGADLKESKFARARLLRGSLFQAKLQEANLENTDLSEANLEQANIERAYLSNAKLEKCKLSRVNLQHARLDNANLQFAHLDSARMDHAKLKSANLKNADLSYSMLRNAHLRNTNLDYANLKAVNFSVAGLEDASLNGANLEDALFLGTYLQGASFRACVVNGRTWINTKEINNYTDFRGVALGNVRIKSTTKQKLEYNKRRLNWEDWYKDHRWQKWIVQLFWLMSDYGASTLRVVMSFLILVIIFSALYFVLALKNIRVLDGLCDDSSKNPRKILQLRTLFRSVYFSIVTMTTLGFGDIKAHRNSTVGQLIVILQVVCGYLLLGALITRLGILFTAGGPSG